MNCVQLYNVVHCKFYMSSNVKVKPTPNTNNLRYKKVAQIALSVQGNGTSNVNI